MHMLGEYCHQADIFTNQYSKFMDSAIFDILFCQ